MTTTVEAIYHQGVLRLETALPLPDNARVRVTIQSSESLEDAVRAQWLMLSEASLCKAWEAPGDDVFNELLAK